jgi:hypothetical protein
MPSHKITLTGNAEVFNNAAFQWRFAVCMLDTLKSMLTLHDDDIQEAVVLMALGIRQLAPVIGSDNVPVDKTSLAELTLFLSREGDGTRLGELARFAWMNRSTTKRKLDRLIARGLVVCEDGVAYRLAPDITVNHPAVATMLIRNWTNYRRLSEHLLTARVIEIEL